MEQGKLEAIVNALQTEWQCGGLGPETMYGEFAIEVARRAVAAEIERWQAHADAMAHALEVFESQGSDKTEALRAYRAFRA